MAARKTQEEFLAELTEELTRTGDTEKYNLSKVSYIDAKHKVIITCLEHGDLEVAPFHWLNGRRCSKCRDKNLSDKFRGNWEDILNRVNTLHNGYYSYDKFVYVKMADKGIITCPKHGDFKMSILHHLRGQGCKECSTKLRAEQRNPILHSDFLIKAVELHKDRYSYEKVNYINCKEKVTITCPTHGDFECTPGGHINSFSGCPLCSFKVSTAELEIRSFVEGLGLEIVCNKKAFPGSKHHIDIFVPSLKVGIEYCGIYYHSEKFKQIGYHKFKYEKAVEQGITLLQIFEDEWIHKRDIVKNILLQKLGKSTSTYYARKLQIKAVTNVEAISFYEKVHLQGGGSSYGYSLGLYSKDTLVACMSFSSLTKDIGTIELTRFASVGRITGGFSKLLINSIKELRARGIGTILSFSDNRLGIGRVYLKNGFTSLGSSAPRYWWAYDSFRWHRRLFQRKYLPNRLKTFDPSKSEAINCRENGFRKIWDAGVTKWELKI
jgi:hypothetical protein